MADGAPQHLGLAHIESTVRVVDFALGQLWTTYTLAADWLADAIGEAESPLGASDEAARLAEHRSRIRREILFAVCAVECYLVEWVRDEVLNRDFKRLRDYFPTKPRRGIREKWRSVPELLVCNGLLARLPATPAELYTLIGYRDGLVHARTARPSTKGTPQAERPCPDFTILNRLPRGWACEVVVASIEGLHAAAGTTAPTWLRCAALAP